MLKQPFNGTSIVTRGFIKNIHLGVDYATEHRTAIIAVASGVVSKLNNTETRNWLANTPSDPFKKGVGKVIYYRSLTTADYGKYVKIDHGSGISTLYAHLDEVTVYDGQAVVEGQLIGYSDSTGNSTGSHLHFEIRKNDLVIDPNTFDYNFIGKEVLEPKVFDLSDKVKVVISKLYVRSGPARTYPLRGSKELYKGDIVDVNGVTEGEEIDGIKFWYRSVKGNYFWSGGTDKPLTELPKTDKEEKMTKEQYEAKKLELDNLRTGLEARKAELEVATVENNTKIEEFNKAWEEFASETVDEVVEPVEAPVETPVEVPAEPVAEVVSEPVVEEVKVDEGLPAEEEKKVASEYVSKLEALIADVKERFHI